MKSALFLSVLFGILICAFNAKAMDEEEAAEEERGRHSSLPSARYKGDQFLRELDKKREGHLVHGRIIRDFLRKQYPPSSSAMDYSEDEKDLFNGYFQSRAERGDLTTRQAPIKQLLWLYELNSTSLKELEMRFTSKFRVLLYSPHSSGSDAGRTMEVFLDALRRGFKESVDEAYTAATKPTSKAAPEMPESSKLAFSNRFLQELYEQQERHHTFGKLIGIYLDPLSRPEDEEEVKGLLTLFCGEYIRSRVTSKVTIPDASKLNQTFVEFVREQFFQAAKSQPPVDFEAVYAKGYLSPDGLRASNAAEKSKKLQYLLEGLKAQYSKAFEAIRKEVEERRKAPAPQPHFEMPVFFFAAPVAPWVSIKVEEITEFRETTVRISVFNSKNRPWKVKPGQKVTFSCHCNIPVGTLGKPRCSLEWYEGINLSTTIAPVIQALANGENSVGALVPDDIPGVVITGVVPAFFNASAEETRFEIRDIRLTLEPGPTIKRRVIPDEIVP